MQTKSPKDPVAPAHPARPAPVVQAAAAQRKRMIPIRTTDNKTETYNFN